MSDKRKVDAAVLLDLLAAKHAQDVFVAECKDGPSWGVDGHRRLDAWALRRSWSPLTTVGYEIKATRQDFEQDQKWLNYWPLCHELYLVCPPKLVTAADLPTGVGLIWSTMSGSKLHTKIKAERRQPDADQQLLLQAYVLMSRVRVVANMYEANGSHEPPADDLRERTHVERLRACVEAAGARQELAQFVGAHVRTAFNELRARVDAAERADQEVQRFVADLASHGINYDPRCGFDWGARTQALRLAGAVDAGLTRTMCSLARQLDGLADECSRVVAAAGRREKPEGRP